MTLGQIRQGMGQYAKAIEAYESVRPNSSKRLEARTRAGASHWQQSLALRRQGKTAEADAEVQKAIDVLKESYKARQEAGAAAADAGLIGNACDLAEIYLETGKADEALALLDPLAKAADRPGERRPQRLRPSRGSSPPCSAPTSPPTRSTWRWRTWPPWKRPGPRARA